MTTPPDHTVSRAAAPTTIPEAHELVDKMRDDFRMGGFKVGDVARLLAFVRALPTTPPAADDPTLDATDGAHPAWWRGHDHTASAMCKQLAGRLGVESNGDDWQALLVAVSGVRQAERPAADELPALRGLLALFERLAAGAQLRVDTKANEHDMMWARERGVVYAYEYATGMVRDAIADLEKATEGRAPLPLCGRCNNDGPQRELCINMYCGRDRREPAPPAVGEHAALLARADKQTEWYGRRLPHTIAADMRSLFEDVRDLATALRASEARREKAEADLEVSRGLHTRANELAKSAQADLARGRVEPIEETMMLLANATRLADNERERANGWLRRAEQAEQERDTARAELNATKNKSERIESDRDGFRVALENREAELKAAQEKLAAIEAVPVDVEALAEVYWRGVGPDAERYRDVHPVYIDGLQAVVRSLIAASTREVAADAFWCGYADSFQRGNGGNTKHADVIAGLLKMWSAVAPALAASQPVAACVVTDELVEEAARELYECNPEFVARAQIWGPAVDRDRWRSIARSVLTVAAARWGAGEGAQADDEADDSVNGYRLPTSIAHADTADNAAYIGDVRALRNVVAELVREARRGRAGR